VIARRAVGAGIVALVAALTAAGGAGAQVESLSVEADRTEIATGLGSEFGFRTTITNRAATATPALIAHLNILSLRGDVYVDPEDWSTQRTQYLGTIPAGSSRTLAWKLKGVNGGSLAAYVAILPQSNPSRAPATSPAIPITVAERRTLNSGGILPLALGVPAFVGLLAGGIRIARRRR
jgi:hypothetical protein